MAPLYDYLCSSCHREFEAIRSVQERASCTCECGGLGRKILKPGKAPGASLFHPYVEYNISHEPIYVRTPQELRNACDEHNCYSERLENGIWKTSPGPDPTPRTAPELFGGREE